MKKKILKPGAWATRNNASENRFEQKLISEGKTLIAQPYLQEFHLRPDFYCPEEDTYYEVIGTRQAWYQKRLKIQEARDKGLKIVTVDANGDPYPYSGPRKTSPVNSEGETTFEYLIKNIPDDLLVAAKKKAIDLNKTMKQVLLDALKKFVEGE